MKFAWDKFLHKAQKSPRKVHFDAKLMSMEKTSMQTVVAEFGRRKKKT